MHPKLLMTGIAFNERFTRSLGGLLLVILSTSLLGCSYIQGRYGEVCKSRAYIRIPVEEHLTTQFPNNSMIRMGIVPLVTPANLAGYSDQSPPLGAQLAWRLHGEILRTGKIPIVEVTGWHDWPLKREDFFTGNFQSLKRARESGFDLVFVGLLEQSTPEEAAVLGKIIDVQAGLTLWYGRIYGLSHRTQVNRFADSLAPSRDHSIERFDLFPLYNKLMECVAAESLSDEGPTSERLGLFDWFSHLS